MNGKEPSSTAFLELVDVRKEFGGAVVVEGFNLRATRGEFVTFLGPSGCGKTTTLRMIAGFESPSAGRVAIDGADVTSRPPNRRNVGMVFQSYALFPNMTVADNVAFGLRIRKRRADEIRRRVGELLELIDLPGRERRYPHQLSGGQQQRVALARALAIEPQVLLLDEPLSALDAKIRLSLRRQIRSIQRELGITTVYVTHDQEEALSLSDRVVVMSQGRIEQVGTPSAIYNFPSTPFVARFVGTLSVLPGRIIDPGAGRIAVDGQEIGTATSIVNHAPGAPVSVALRPESIVLGDGGEGSNSLRGPVDDVSFLGSVVRIRIGLDGVAEGVALDVFNDPNLRIPALGSVVSVAFSREACIVLDEQPASPEAAPGEQALA